MFALRPIPADSGRIEDVNAVRLRRPQSGTVPSCDCDALRWSCSPSRWRAPSCSPGSARGTVAEPDTRPNGRAARRGCRPGLAGSRLPLRCRDSDPWLHPLNCVVACRLPELDECQRVERRLDEVDVSSNRSSWVQACVVEYSGARTLLKERWIVANVVWIHLQTFSVEPVHPRGAHRLDSSTGVREFDVDPRGRNAIRGRVGVCARRACTTSIDASDGSTTSPRVAVASVGVGVAGAAGIGGRSRRGRGLFELARPVPGVDAPGLLKSCPHLLCERLLCPGDPPGHTAGSG